MTRCASFFELSCMLYTMRQRIKRTRYESFLLTFVISSFLQDIGNRPCPALSYQGRAGQVALPAGQGKVTKIFKGQVAGYECHNLSTCDKFCVSDIVYIFSKVKHMKKKNRKKENKLIIILDCLNLFNRNESVANLFFIHVAT